MPSSDLPACVRPPTPLCLLSIHIFADEAAHRISSFKLKMEGEKKDGTGLDGGSDKHVVLSIKHLHGDLVGEERRLWNSFFF